MPYTSGEWHVKPGREDEFVKEWYELARWTVDNVRGASWARLLRDREQPTRFVSIGPWDDDEAIGEWRSHPVFKERIGRLRELVERFDARILDPATEVGAPD
jgi:heme-degrading monooxygenase HmoA